MAFIGRKWKQQDHDSPPAVNFVVVAQTHHRCSEIGKKKKEEAERHYRRQFWEQLLDKAKTRATLHATCPRVRTLAFHCQKGHPVQPCICDGAGVELPSTAVIGSRTRRLRPTRREGVYRRGDRGELVWKRAEDPRAWSIRSTEGSLFDTEGWAEMQTSMIGHETVFDRVHQEA